MIHPTALLRLPTRPRVPDLRATGDWSRAQRAVGRLTATVELVAGWWEWSLVWHGARGETYKHSSGVATDRDTAVELCLDRLTPRTVVMPLVAR